MAYLKKALPTTSRARPSKGKENCCSVSGIWDVGFFVSKNEWKKQNLGRVGDQAMLPQCHPFSLAPPHGVTKDLEKKEGATLAMRRRGHFSDLGPASLSQSQDRHKAVWSHPSHTTISANPGWPPGTAVRAE